MDKCEEDPNYDCAKPTADDVDAVCGEYKANDYDNECFSSVVENQDAARGYAGYCGYPEIDWEVIFNDCPRWGAYANSACHGPLNCTRTPTEAEAQDICVDYSLPSCNQHRETHIFLRYCESKEEFDGASCPVWKAYMDKCEEDPNYDCAKPTADDVDAVCGEYKANDYDNECFSSVVENQDAARGYAEYCGYPDFSTSAPTPLTSVPTSSTGAPTSFDNTGDDSEEMVSAVDSVAPPLPLFLVLSLWIAAVREF